MSEGTEYTAMGRINRIGVLTIDAYGVAVKNGFDGTVEEWLESLKGKGIESVEQGVTVDVGQAKKTTTTRLNYTDGTTTEISVSDGNGSAIHLFNTTDYSNTIYGYPLEAVTVAEGQALKVGDLLLTSDGDIYVAKTVTTKGVKVSFGFNIKNDTNSGVTMADRTTGELYSLYIDNGKLMMDAKEV